MKRIKLLLVMVLVAPFQLALAEDCPRGTLDEQYCDRDGDLVADLPLDEGEWVAVAGTRTLREGQKVRLMTKGRRG